MSNEAVCRTAPATPGLLISLDIVLTPNDPLLSPLEEMLGHATAPLIIHQRSSGFLGFSSPKNEGKLDRRGSKVAEMPSI